MEWVIILILVFGFIDISEKLNKLLKNTVSKTDYSDNLLKDYVSKEVNLKINNGDIFGTYDIENSKVKILDYDNTWILIEYKEGKKIVNRYIRRIDITSINEINNS